MATKKDLTKEEKIKREFSRLKRIFKDLDKNVLGNIFRFIPIVYESMTSVDNHQLIGVNQ